MAILYFVTTLFSFFIKADTRSPVKPEIREKIKRNYRLLLISIVHNGSVAFLNSIILIFAYEYLRFSVTSMAGIVMAAGIFGVLSRPVAGYLSDTYNELHIMIIGFLFRIVSFLLIIGFSNIGVLLLAAIFFTLATATVGTPLYTFVSRSTEKEELSSVLSLVNVSGDFGRVLLPFCGGFLYERFHPTNPFIFGIILNACIISVVLSLRRSSPHQ